MIVVKALCFALLASLAFAQAPTGPTGPMKLWDASGEFVHDYDILVRGLRSGSKVELEPGRVVTIEKVLGKGNTTRVYSIGGGKALRLAISSSLVQATSVYAPAFLEFYYDGYTKLQGSDLPHIKVFTQESDRKHFLIVEELPIRFTLGDYLHEGKSDPAIDFELYEFARKSWQIRKIGDMHVDQVAYVEGKGWVLIDFADKVKAATSTADATMFTYMLNLPLAMKKKLNAIVIAERTDRASGRAGRVRCLVDQVRRMLMDILKPVLPGA